MIKSTSIKEIAIAGTTMSDHLESLWLRRGFRCGAGQAGGARKEHLKWDSEEVEEAAEVWAARPAEGAWEDRAPQALEGNACALSAGTRWITSPDNPATTTSVPSAVRQ